MERNRGDKSDVASEKARERKKQKKEGRFFTKDRKQEWGKTTVEYGRNSKMIQGETEKKLQHLLKGEETKRQGRRTHDQAIGGEEEKRSRVSIKKRERSKERNEKRRTR